MLSILPGGAESSKAVVCTTASSHRLQHSVELQHRNSILFTLPESSKEAVVCTKAFSHRLQHSAELQRRNSMHFLPFREAKSSQRSSFEDVVDGRCRRLRARPLLVPLLAGRRKAGWLAVPPCKYVTRSTSSA